MSMVRKTVRWLSIDALQPEIATAQAIELQRQIPLLYALLTVNAVAVAYTHYPFTPIMLSVVAPAVLVLVCAARIVVWLRRRKETVATALVIARLRKTIVLAVLMSVAYISWALAIDGYGGAYEQGQIALFIAITVIGCIFCLMHLPQAALAVTVVVTVPYLIYYVRLGNPVFVSIALNIFLVTAVMLQVLFNSYDTFTRLIRSQADLALKQEETGRLNEENTRLAHTDALTGLPNRRYFFSRLEAEIDAATKTGRRFAVGVLDLDRFKPVNDTYGHVLGDRALADIGERLVRMTGETLVVARLGGDEFGFICMEGSAEAMLVGQAICDALARPYLFDDIRVSIGCSGGLAIFPDSGLTPHDLFGRADYALYNSKLARLGKMTQYSAEHETAIRSERAIEIALRAADLGEEMEVHFQPIVDTRQGTLLSVEALGRWKSPSLGHVPPNVFIAIAERTGIIHTLTLTLFEKALADLRHLPADVRMSFNLSANDITCPQTILAVIAAVGRSGIEPKRLTMELTETAVMRNFDAAVESMRLLRRLGMKIALDDFGTGYSSLGYLQRLPVDTIKIDRSFVLELGKASGRDIVSAIVGLCRNMRLGCIAEGVETEEQLRILEELHCDTFQGYFFSRPMPAAALGQWLEASLYGTPSMAPVRDDATVLQIAGLPLSGRAN